MSVSAILQSVLLLFHPRFQARQIQIVDDCAAETRIQCFSDEIRQDFVNLVSNAFDATPDGGRLRVRIRNASLNRVPGVHVTVSDSGSGILLPIQKHIFEPFFSTKDTTGIGLGL
jgi:signal transduction histidine kinase